MLMTNGDDAFIFDAHSTYNHQTYVELDAPKQSYGVCYPALSRLLTPAVT
jgi:hypothetical protein